MKLFYLSIKIFVFILINTSSHAQTEIKPYIKDINGNIHYFEEIKEGIAKKGKTKLIKSRGYTGYNNGNRTEFPSLGVSSLTYKSQVEKGNAAINQIIYLPIDWRWRKLNLSNNEGMWIYQIDTSRALSKCVVLFAKNDTLFLHARITTGSSSDVNFDHNLGTGTPMQSTGANTTGGSSEAWRLIVKIGDKLHYIGAYSKKSKTLKSYQVLIDAFSTTPEVHSIAQELLQTKIYQTKKIYNIFERIQKTYFNKYYQEL